MRKRKIETSTERLAWLIIFATIPVGILGLLLEHPIRVALAKPLAASIFLVVNGFILLGAERFRSRAEVRALAAREGMKRDGGRAAGHARVPRGGRHRVRPELRADRRDEPRRNGAWPTGLVRGLDNEDAARFAFLLATPPILAAGLFKFGDLTGSLGSGHPRATR